MRGRGLGARLGGEAWGRGLGARLGVEAWGRWLGGEAWGRGLGARLGGGALWPGAERGRHWSGVPLVVVPWLLLSNATLCGTGLPVLSFDSSLH